MKVRGMLFVSRDLMKHGLEQLFTLLKGIFYKEYFE